MRPCFNLQRGGGVEETPSTICVQEHHAMSIIPNVQELLTLYEELLFFSRPIIRLKSSVDGHFAMCLGTS